jgi:hypothetical protein
VQYHDFRAWLNASQNQLNAVVVGIMLVLDFIDPEPIELKTYGPRGRPPWPNTVVERCEASLGWFKAYIMGWHALLLGTRW